MDQLGENSKVFNDLLTEITDLDNIRHNNAKGPKGEVAAGGSYKKLILLDASNIVQLAESGTEVRVPADPTNVLGIATKQYVDGVQMFQTQPLVSGATGATNFYTTILNLAATTRGHIRALYAVNGGVGGTISVRITIDGGTPIVYTTSAIIASNYRGLQPNLTWSPTDQTNANLVSFLTDIAFNSSILIEFSASQNAGTGYVVYDKIP